MSHILDERYRLRGWERAPFAVLDTLSKQAAFVTKDQLVQLMRCNGAHVMEPASMEGQSGDFLRSMEAEGIIRPARLGEFLLPEQEYQRYPARYKRSAHWSITGSCNLRCRHCFMSAPSTKHGNPTHGQLMRVVDQLAECGVFRVGLTGGEPLIREDFLEIVEALAQRGIGIDVIYTNGWLVDERLLDALDRTSPDRRIPFQLSFDGIGQHDFLRGVPGAEERTLEALGLLRGRGYPINVSLCLHRGNMDTIRESVRLMASLGVRSMKVDDGPGRMDKRHRRREVGTWHEALSSTSREGRSLPVWPAWWHSRAQHAGRLRMTRSKALHQRESQRTRGFP